MAPVTVRPRAADPPTALPRVPRDLLARLTPAFPGCAFATDPPAGLAAFPLALTCANLPHLYGSPAGRAAKAREMADPAYQRLFVLDERDRSGVAFLGWDVSLEETGAGDVGSDNDSGSRHEDSHDEGSSDEDAHDEVSRDEGRVVVYCLELQVAPSHQGRGLGAYLLSLMARIAALLGIRTVMLTVQKDNVRARQLYAKAGFVVDPTSPSACLSASEAKAYDYEILSKSVLS